MKVRHYRVNEDDLQKLEALLPRVFDRLVPQMNDPALQIMAEELKRIVSDVRWDYGPPSEVRQLPAMGNEQSNG